MKGSQTWNSDKKMTRKQAKRVAAKRQHPIRRLSNKVKNDEQVKPNLFPLGQSTIDFGESGRVGVASFFAFSAASTAASNFFFGKNVFASSNSLSM